VKKGAYEQAGKGGSLPWLKKAPQKRILDKTAFI
jgi:hypothetical protein